MPLGSELIETTHADRPGARIAQDVLVSYLVGFGVGSLLFSVTAGIFMVLTGMFLALPLLLFAVLISVCLRRQVDTHLLFSSIIAPILAVASWVLGSYYLSPAKPDFVHFVSQRFLVEQVGIALTCSSLAAATFFLAAPLPA
jgi:ABC-type dipeptide/oligopeptide/nickel transport system permease subunit